MGKVFLYELNEVPWKVIDHYIEKRPNCFLKSLLKKSEQYNTHTADTGELHPWSTWPTVHRGVHNEVHGIRYINQDLAHAQKYPPIWEVVCNHGKTAGVIGSLQSYPAYQHPNMLFHVPDTFAKTEHCIPSKYNAFQKFNLKMTGDNSATASKIGPQDLFSGIKAIQSGIKYRSLMKIAKHLFLEKMNPLQKTLRPTLQAHLAFDILLGAINQQKPDLITFFTNHVAGLMHKYWKHAFIEDCDESDIPVKNDRHFFHKESILKGMDIFDQQIKQVHNFCKTNHYTLMVASSMGQEYVNKGQYQSEIRVKDFKCLLKFIGHTGTVKVNLAMHPDALEFNTVKELKHCRDLITNITFPDESPLIECPYEAKGLTLNLNINSTKFNPDKDYLSLNRRKFDLRDAGLETFNRDPLTAYHQPNGILIINTPNEVKKQSNRPTLDTREISRLIIGSLEL